MSPEIVFQSLVGLWTQPEWRKRLRAVVVHGAHCIGTWGLEFRKHYGLLGQLRSKVARITCFLAISTTLPPAFLSTVISTLYFKNVEVVNVGNDRINVKYIPRFCHENGNFAEASKIRKDRPPLRIGAEKARALKVIKTWRLDAFNFFYRDRCHLMGLGSVMPDSMTDKLAASSTAVVKAVRIEKDRPQTRFAKYNAAHTSISTSTNASTSISRSAEQDRPQTRFAKYNAAHTSISTSTNASTSISRSAEQDRPQTRLAIHNAADTSTRTANS
ncbi:hypothetical protein BC939DRAFT_501526 [Gamsiella multidivaricata]|uniref:uncharacterized protein n=1 Tax=Gamsiella multidivaricata TaxID=101098 RepID=UPI0022202D53|nr:uncharacterized protein BC939DRAFT_501526 [Gamsiella multidivaricata]KAI7826864.1 hypothetical protein BC939DRAFT_501526 [Gamsiella multidivaricata]